LFFFRRQVLYALSRTCFNLGDATGATAQAFLPRFSRAPDPKKAHSSATPPAALAPASGTAKAEGPLASPEGGGGAVEYGDSDPGRGGIGGGESAAMAAARERALRVTTRRILALTGVVAVAASSTALAVPLLAPRWFTTDPTVTALMATAAPLAALGLLLHPAVVGLEGVLLATRDVAWLVKSYALTGALGVAATQVSGDRTCRCTMSPPHAAPPPPTRVT
jgi:hypothetical protein